MHNQETIKMGFDPSKLEDETLRAIFKDHVATVLWCSIKSGHIVDQYFNDLILECAAKADIKEHSYHAFIKSMQRLTNQYGKICVYETQLGFNQYEIDHEFWGDIFNAILYKRCFRLEYNNA